MTDQPKTRKLTREDLSRIISENPMTGFQIFVAFLCFVLNMNDGIDVMVVSYTGSEIQAEWGISNTLQGYIYSAALAGMTLGCLFLAPLADRIGRRKLFIIAMTTLSASMIGSAYVESYYVLLVLRFFAGLGIGGLLPTLAAITAEFSNKFRKDLAVGFVQAGYPIGAILTGFFTAWAVPEFGWRYAFMGAGIFSLLMLILVILFMPESIDYLLLRRPKNALKKVNTILKKIGEDEIDELPEIEAPRQANVKTLFMPEYKSSTIRLWIGIFFGFMTLYTLISWVPSIATQQGLPFEMATYVGMVLNVGAFIGSTGIGWLAAKFNLRKLIFTFFMIAFSIMVIYGNLPLSTALIFIATFLIGIFVQGGFNGYWPTTARVYDAEVRTTGIGWATGAGRLGAIAGPALFGYLTDLNFSIPNLFIIFSIPLVVSGIAAYKIPSKNLDLDTTEVLPD